MLSPRADLAAVLDRARSGTPDAAASWLDAPPAGTHRLDRHIALLSGADLGACADALLTWELHRGAGLMVAADGDVAAGATVALGVRLGPLVVTAPCRVLDVVRSAERAAFTYATLPGHPEQGVEEFAFSVVPGGLVFAVSAVSRPAFWASRARPRVHARFQNDVTDRYLRSAVEIARRSTAGNV